MSQVLGASSRDASSATTVFWGAQPPFFAIPLLHLNWLLGWSCWDVWAISHEGGQDYQYLIFLLIWLDCIDKVDDIADRLICCTNPTRSFWVFFLWRLSLFSHFCLYTQVPFSSNTFHYGGLSYEGIIAFQLPRGKQVPWCLWLGNIWSSVVMVFGRRGSLASANLSTSRLQGASWSS